jgi:hypothetical protein
MPYELVHLIVVTTSIPQSRRGLERFDRRCGFEMSAVQDQQLGVGGPDFPRWNRLQHWFELAEAFRTA